MSAIKKSLKIFQVAIVLCASLAIYDSAFAQGKNGTTLAAYKTVDICSVSSNPNIWRYSGEISIWNQGAVDTVGLKITDFIQYKTGSDWQSGPTALNFEGGEIPAGTTQATAITFPYSVEGRALPGTIRNVATITIMNHSGSLGTPKGPEPKATFIGEVKPCANAGGGCTYTQGYWGNKPGVIWPSPYIRTNPFYMSGQTWQQVMNTPVNLSQGYYQLAHQYIAAVLNKANGAAVPDGVATTLDAAKDWLNLNAPLTCTANGSCGVQKSWAKILDDYNNGKYPNGPQHCE
jgi:hypothetical protein